MALKSRLCEIMILRFCRMRHGCCSPSVPARGRRAKRSRTLPRGGGALSERPDSPGDVTRRGLTRRLANFLGISSPQRSMTSSPTPDAAQQVAAPRVHVRF